jgi:hypothetical protein
MSALAYNLFTIFLTFDTPIILHSDNSREFVNSVVNKIKELYCHI